jgi:hypothetical protein
VTTQTKMDNWGGPPEMAGVLGTLAPPAQRALLGLAVAFRDMERDHAEAVAGLEEKNKERRLEIETLEAENERLTVRDGELQREVRALREEASKLRAMNDAFLDERAALRAKEAAAEAYNAQRRRVDDLLQEIGGALHEPSGPVGKMCVELAAPATNTAALAGATIHAAPADPGSKRAERRGGGEVELGARRVPTGDAGPAGAGGNTVDNSADPQGRTEACAVGDADAGTATAVACTGGGARVRPVTRSARDPS